MGYMSGKNGVSSTPSISSSIGKNSTGKNSVSSYSSRVSKNSTGKNSVTNETPSFTSKKLQGATLIKHYLELVDKEEKLQVRSRETIKELADTQNQITEMRNLILTDPRFEFLRQAVIDEEKRK